MVSILVQNYGTKESSQETQMSLCSAGQNFCSLRAFHGNGEGKEPIAGPEPKPSGVPGTAAGTCAPVQAPVMAPLKAGRCGACAAFEPLTGRKEVDELWLRR